MIKTLKFVSASTKGFKGGFAWIKPSKKDMAVTFSHYYPKSWAHLATLPFPIPEELGDAQKICWTHMS